MTEIRTRLPPPGTRACLRVAQAVLLLPFALLPVAAHAAGPKRAGVPKFDGAQEALVRKQVMQVLKTHGYELAKSREMETAMQNSGALLESDDGFQKISKELSLTVIVTGEVGKKRAKITIHDGREGSVLGEASFPGANPKKIAAEVGKSFWNQLGADIARGHVPSGAKKPQKVAEAPEDDENAPDADSGGAPPPPEPESRSKKQKGETVAAAEGAPGGEGGEGEAPLPKKKKKKKKQAKMEADAAEEEESGPGTIPYTFDVSVGGLGLNRSLSYSQDRSASINPMDLGMRPYNLPFGAALAIDIVGYPLSSFTDSFAQNIGLEGGFEQEFGIASTLAANPSDPTFPMGAKFGTTVHQFEGGARYRIPFGLAGHQVWFSLTGGEHAFVFTSSPGCAMTTPSSCRPNLDIPDTIYRYVRPGVGARFELPANFALAATLGFRFILNDAGPQFGQFFPHHSVYGVDAALYVAYLVFPHIEVRLGGELRQYGYAMNSTQADVAAIMSGSTTTLKVAGGAVDRYLSGSIGVAFVFGGSDRPEPAAEDEAPAPKKKKKHHRDSDEDAGGGGGDDASGGGGGDSDQ